MAKDKKAKSDELTCTINKIYGQTETKIFADVTWGDGERKFNIRSKFTDANGELKLRKGISLTREECEALSTALNTMLKETKGVQFQDIFDDSDSIVENRKAGHTTVDGFIQLIKKTKS